MNQEMPSIDTSGIEALRGVKAEGDLVKTRLEKMISMKDKVSEEVYEKVFAEYSQKLDEITDKAEPLKNELRGEYQVLDGLLKRLEEELKAIELEREELVFRFELGEFEDDFYQDQLHKWEVRHTSKQAELEEAEGMKEAFLSVFESEEDLTLTPDMSTIPVGNLQHDMMSAPVEAEAEQKKTEVVESMPLTPPPAQEPEPEMDLDDSINDLDPVVDETLDQVTDLVDDEDLTEDENDEDEDFFKSADVEDPEKTAAMGELQLMPELPDELEADLEADAVMDDLDDLDDLNDLGDDDLSDDDLSDDITDELVTDELDDELVDDLVDDLDDLDDSLEDDLMDEDTGKMSLPPALPMDESTVRADQVAMPPLPQDKDATLLMEQLPVAGGQLNGEPETMIIATPKIVSMNNATEGQTIVLGMGTTSLGRSPENDIHITEDRISRKHSQITFGPGGYALYDLNSENGTFVNGQRIREHFLQDGDIVQVGTYKYLYRDH